MTAQRPANSPSTPNFAAASDRRAPTPPGAPEADPHHRGAREPVGPRPQRRREAAPRSAPPKHLERTIAALIISLRAALDSSHAEIESVRDEAARLALAIAKKIAPAALAALPAGDVENALREAMHQAIGEPRITLRAAPEVIAALEAASGRHRP